MKKNTFLIARVAGLFIAAALLAGCYAPLVNQNGYLNLAIEGARGAGTNEAIVLVVNADYKDSFKELIWLIDKGQDTGNLSGSDTDRLTQLAKQMATNGLVKFGGFPFFQTTLSPSSGSFQISGVPAGRDYFVKFLVFNTNVSFKVEDIDAHFGNLIQVENRVFDHNEDYTTGGPWQAWAVLPGQQVTVKSGETVTLNVGTLVPRT